MTASSVGFRDLVKGLKSIGLTQDSAVIVHASLSSFGQVPGGASTVLGALLSTVGTLVMPAFTCKAMVWPMSGPPDNGVTYGRRELDDANRDAVLFHPDLPVDRDIGIVAETLRQQPSATRSSHLVLSFVAAGEHAAEAVATQTTEQPLAPIEWLQHHGGDVLLIGVGHTRNTSIHFAEKLANRKQFTRWAIMLEDKSSSARAVRLPNFPGCSDGFDAIEPEIARATTQATIGQAIVRRIPLGMLIPVVVGWIGDDPEALLCARPDCERCQDVRRSTGTPANHG